MKMRFLMPTALLSVITHGLAGCMSATHAVTCVTVERMANEPTIAIAPRKGGYLFALRAGGIKWVDEPTARSPPRFDIYTASTI